MTAELPRLARLLSRNRSCCTAKMRLFLALTVIFCASRVTFGLPPISKFLNGTEDGQIWVLLVAGSNGYYNYRHQADVCHAYQIFHQHGIPDENIVVMMYDDIAYNEENPDQGKIVNHVNGPNVYPGVPHDYTKEDVTPENFLKILQGQDMSGTGSGKVIKSGPNDYVFVNFADHGAPNFVAFPDGELTAQQLNDAIKSMHANNQYKQMVVYIEACESGSMFYQKLAADINVYATTAANPDESSYACYYDSAVSTYVGDCYSVNWMENVDKVGTATETLEEQYKIVKQETTESHVMQYGDLNIDNEVLGKFMGSKNSELPLTNLELSPPVSKDAVPVGDVRISILAHKIYDSGCYWEKRKHEHKLMEELVLREKVRQTVEEIVHVAVGGMDDLKESIFSKPAKTTDFDCYTSAVRRFSEKCFKLSEVDLAMRLVYTLSNVCETGVGKLRVLSAIEQVC